MTKTLHDFFKCPEPPVIPRDAYAPQLMPLNEGQDISSLMPAAGQNAVPQPQRLFNLNIATPFRWLWKRPANVIQGPF